MQDENDTSEVQAALATELTEADVPIEALRRRAEELGLPSAPDALPEDLAADIQQRQALLNQLDEATMHEILAWARKPALAGADKEELARRIARIRKWNYHRLSHKALLTLALLRNLDLQEADPPDKIVHALRSRESFRQRLRRKRRALVASLVGKVMGLPRGQGAQAPARCETAASSPDLKEQIVERGLVRGLASTIRGVTDDYIRQKLDEIEQRIDHKLNEIDHRLQEWRDREIANRLRIIKITLVASILVAILSFGYSRVKSHVAQVDRPGVTATTTEGSAGASSAHGGATPTAPANSQ